MKKCLLMFAFLLATLLIAMLWNEGNQQPSDERMAHGDNSETILAIENR